MLAAGFALPVLATGCDWPSAERTAVPPDPVTAAAGPDGVQLAYAKDGDLLALTGEVAELSEAAFLLNYGVGKVSVRAPSAKLAELKRGRAVRVVGRIDTSGSSRSILADQIILLNEPAPVLQD